MPPLPVSVEIPVIVRSPWKGKQPLRSETQRRTYTDKPLPVRPSDQAPKNAKITGRIIDLSGVVYQLKIGDVEINDVGVEEILEYVSALDLEEYEHRQFEEEREVLKALEVQQEQHRQEKLERMKSRAKTKGVILFETDSDTNEDAGAATDGEAALGRHGRARPTYTHLFKKGPIRKGKSIAPSDRGMMQTSGDEDENEEGFVARETVVRGPVSFAELPKRRRRKRDKVTGELLPLSPIAMKTKQPVETQDEKKRQRRKRHPLTGELMPLGWRYDPNDDQDTYEKRRAGQALSARKPSVSQEHEAKRLKLDKSGEGSRSLSPLPTTIGPSKLATPLKPSVVEPRTAFVNLLSSEDEIEPTPRKTGTAVRRPSKIGKSLPLSSAADETSPEPPLKAFSPRKSPNKTNAISSQALRQMKSPSKQPTTSIMNPSAGRESSIDLAVPPSEEEEETDDSVGDDEWFIEAVLAHSWSDPRTHPIALGDKPVMLYKVKWEGYTDPTWEPVESFTDRSVLDEYRRRAGLPAENLDQGTKEGDDDDVTLSALPQPAQKSDSEDEELDEDEYEVEGIVDHQLSDPRTHPAALGKQPVMLYKVKWKGYRDLTWEPATSFGDAAVVQAYNKRRGIAGPSAGILVDEEMEDAG